VNWAASLVREEAVMPFRLATEEEISGDVEFFFPLRPGEWISEDALRADDDASEPADQSREIEPEGGEV
jgi:hypothetical protein